MKKEGQREKARRIRLAIRRSEISLERRCVNCSKAKKNERILRAPKILSFSKNSQKTLAFLRDLKTHATKQPKVKRRGKFVKKPMFVDLASVKSISVPAAVVLAAELHRWALLGGTGRLQGRNIKKWEPRVRTLLRTLGAFDLLGIKPPKIVKEDYKAEVVLMPLESGEKSDGAAVEKLQHWITDFSSVFQPRKYVFEGLTEAILNTIDHAYQSENQKPEFPYAGHRWWATSCFDPVNQSFRFFVYDQGIGIPATIFEKPSWREPVKLMMDKLGLANSDAAIIESAFEIGRTRTKLSQRGKGLQQMRDSIVKAGLGHIRVLSGRGDVTLDSANVIAKTTHSSHVGGTLIEWSLPVDVFEQSK